MTYFADLREYLDLLEEKGKLHRFKHEVVKETQMASLVMLQYRGLPEDQWKTFLFEQVVGVKGRRYGNRVLMGSPASREILALGLKCTPSEIKERWLSGCQHPIEPQLEGSGPAQEVVIEGKELEESGLEGIGVAVEVPGFSGSVRTTTQVITKDVETGLRNVGQYSGHFAGRTELRLAIAPPHHGAIHHVKARRQGKTLQAAIAIGVTPNIALAAASPLPYGTDEFAVAGGVVGEPVKLIKCRTVDLEVPATAEMVIEGEMTDQMEAHAAFGDYPGFVYEVGNRFVPIMKVKCITHRRDPIFVGFDIGYPSTSTTVMDSVAIEVSLYSHFKQAVHMPGVLDVACHASGGGRNFIVIQMKKVAPWDAWQALNALTGYGPMLGKISVVVDDDINPHDPEAVNWAMSFRMQPHRDIRIITHRSPLLDVSAHPPECSNEERNFPSPSGASAMLIDATRKWAYAPVGLPKRQYMEEAMEIWEEEGLPRLNLREPWHGYHLGHWRDEDEENARLLVSGDYAALWRRLNEKRVPVRGPFEP